MSWFKSNERRRRPSVFQFRYQTYKPYEAKNVFLPPPPSSTTMTMKTKMQTTHNYSFCVRSFQFLIEWKLQEKPKAFKRRRQKKIWKVILYKWKRICDSLPKLTNRKCSYYFVFFFCFSAPHSDFVNYNEKKYIFGFVIRKT